MSNRASMIAWLLAGFAFGFLTLCVLGAGGYALWHTHDKTVSAEKTYEDEKAELENFDQRFKGKPVDVKRFQQLNDAKRRAENADNVNTWRQYRQYAFVFLLSSIIPGLITARCLFTAVMRMVKKPKKRKDEEADED